MGFLAQRPYDLLVVVDVDDRLLPLASRDLPSEHDVDLAVTAVLHLRKLEVGDDQTSQTGGAPDVTTFSTKIAANRVKHVACEEDARYFYDVILCLVSVVHSKWYNIWTYGGAADTSRQRPEADG
jgi:hypothetical protein